MDVSGERCILLRKTPGKSSGKPVTGPSEGFGPVASDGYDYVVVRLTILHMPRSSRAVPSQAS